MFPDPRQRSGDRVIGDIARRIYLEWMPSRRQTAEKPDMPDNIQANGPSIFRRMASPCLFMHAAPQTVELLPPRAPMGLPVSDKWTRSYFIAVNRVALTLHIGLYLR